MSNRVPSAEIKEPVEGPNQETAEELHALKTFALRKQGSVPHLVTCEYLQCPSHCHLGCLAAF